MYTSACAFLYFPGISPPNEDRHYKCWKVTGVLPWSALIFVAGFSLREYGAFHYNNLEIFISSLVLLYAAPYVLSPTQNSSAHLC